MLVACRMLIVIDKNPYTWLNINIFLQIDCFRRQPQTQDPDQDQSNDSNTQISRDSPPPYTPEISNPLPRSQFESN